MAICFPSPETENEIFHIQLADDLDWPPDMASPDEKIETLRQRVGTVEARLDEISDSLIKIKGDLKWHRIVGGIISTAFVGAFLWSITFYIPDKINDKVAIVDNKIPANFGERFAKMETNIQNVQDRLNRLTPASLNDLIPSPNATMSPAMVTTQLRRASRVIDVAFRTRIPAASDSLAPIRTRVLDIRNRYRGNPRIREAADSLDVRLSAYEDASKQFLRGVAPITIPSDVPKIVPQVAGGIMDLNMICTHPTAYFLGIPQTSIAANEYIINVRVNTCAQKLDGPKWINDNFHGSVIEYNGGPLYLADVSFDDCTFKFGNDSNSKAALSVIMASKGAPVSLLIPQQPE
jgi:hypothetical protein